MIDTVEEAFDVDVHDPVIPPASLTRSPDRVDRGTPGSISIRVPHGTQVPATAPGSGEQPPGRHGPQPSESPAAASLRTLSVCPPGARAAAYSCPTTADSRACRGCRRGDPRSPGSIVHAHQPFPDWP